MPINRQIKEKEVQVIGENGEKVGDAVDWTDEELLLQYQNVKDAGINLAHVNLANHDFKRHLDAIEEVGIFTLIQNDSQLINLLFDKSITDEEVIARARGIISQYEEYRCFYGHLVSDEPNSSRYEDLKFAERRYSKILPNKLFYLNLFPNYATPAQIGTETYKEYLEQYMEVMEMDYLCYDHYPLYSNADGSTKMQDSFLYNMEVAQEAAKGADVWTFLQNIGYSSKKDPNCVEDVRIQSNSALAFGLKGIFWFIYWTIGPAGENFTNGCINFDGSKTHRYEYIKQAGNEIHALWNVLENFEWQRVMTYIGTDNLLGENSSFEFLTTTNNHERIHSVKVTKDTFAGVFKDGEGRDGFMFVNYDTPTSKETNTLKVQFRNCTEAIVYVNGERKQVTVNNGSVSLELKASDAAFIIPLYI